jgi:hypothetical protein
MDVALKYIVIILASFIAGYLIRDFQTDGKGNSYAVVVTDTITDTVYVKSTETVYKDKFVTKYLQDTLILVDSVFVPIPLKTFTEEYNFEYGKVTAEGKVAGELIDLGITTDFVIPSTVTTVKETTTITKQPRGLYVTAGVGSQTDQFKPSVGAVYIRDRYLLGLSTNSLTVGFKIGKK